MGRKKTLVGGKGLKLFIALVADMRAGDFAAGFVGRRRA
jgi:hypothetical protein